MKCLTLIALLAATPVAAQTTTSTYENGVWVHRSRPNSEIDWNQLNTKPDPAIADRVAAAARLRAQRERVEAAQKSREERLVILGQAIRDGRCQEAEDQALSWGDFPLYQVVVTARKNRGC